MKYLTHDHYLICELSKDLAVSVIAEKFELSVYEVKKILKTYGIEARKNRITKGDKIYALIMQGKSDEEIADILDCDTSHVRQVKIKHGINSGRKGPDIEAYKKKCADVDHLRKNGMALSEAVACINIAPNTYQKYRDKTKIFNQVQKPAKVKKQIRNPLKQVSTSELAARR